MNLMLPKISIIVIAYNTENHLSQCIESIINQSYSNIEIIVVNDSSIDKSDDRIILINQEYQGQSIAKNNALDIVSGEYIAFVDGNDWIEQDMIEILYNNAVEYDADISSCNFIDVDKSKDNLSENITILEDFQKISDEIYNSNNFLCNKLFKCHLFNEIRFPESKSFEDAFIIHRLTDNANKVISSSKCKYYRRSYNVDIPLIDIIEAYVEKYTYISPKYPELERVCRYNIFINILRSVNSFYLDGTIETRKEMLQKVVDSVRFYDYTDCGLTPGQLNTIKLILNDLKRYIYVMNISNKKREISQTSKMTGKIKAIFHSYQIESSEDLLEYPHYWVDERYADPIRQFKKIGQSYGIDMAGTTKANYKEADTFFFWDHPRENDKVFEYAIKSNKKLFLIATEPEIINPMNYNIRNKDIFTKIFTWKDSLIDNIKFFKIPPITFSFPKDISFVPFNERKNCVIIATINKVCNYPGELYSKRLETVEWFEKNHPDDLDFFGRDTRFNDINHSNYKGNIKNKLSVLNQYKTCICYENNSSTDEGYITEKIFDAFFCRCIPVYWGLTSSKQVIPKECYIDRCEFDTHEELYDFIKNIDEQQYNKYVEAINTFLESEFAKSYNENTLSKIILKECFDIDFK